MAFVTDGNHVMYVLIGIVNIEVVLVQPSSFQLKSHALLWRINKRHLPYHAYELSKSVT